jgi:hypothetical protein
MAVTSQLFDWVDCLLVVRFDERQGQDVRSIYPEEFLSPDILNSIKMLSMPECLESQENQNFQFMFRINTKKCENDPFSNCYASFSQYKHSSYKRGFFQQSIVLISKYSFISLFYSILARLGSVLNNGVDLPISSDQQLTSSELHSYLEVAFQHFKSWDNPTKYSIDQTLYLPFYGDIFPFSLDYTVISNNNDNNSNSKMKQMTSYGFSDLNIVKSFRRLGLLPHLWTLWEAVITGKDIIVWSPNCAIVSTVVNLLTSLTLPMNYLGDYRPYISTYDQDFDIVSKVLKEKYFHFHNITNVTSPNATISSGINFGYDSDPEISDVDEDDDYYVNASDAYLHDEWSLSEPKFKCLFDEIQLHNRVVPTDLKTSFILGFTNQHHLRSFPFVDCLLLLPNPDLIRGGRSRSDSMISTRPSAFSFVSAMSLFFPPTRIDTTTVTSEVSTKNLAPRKEIMMTATDYTPVTNDDASSNQNASVNPGKDIKIPTISTNKGDEATRIRFNYFRMESSTSSDTELSYATKLKVVSHKLPIETISNEWFESAGALNEKPDTGLICIRHQPTITPHDEILRKVMNLSTEAITVDKYQYIQQESLSNINRDSLTRNSLDALYNGSISDQELYILNEEGSNDEQAIIGNVILRDHLKTLTKSLLLPFELYFKSQHAKLFRITPPIEKDISESQGWQVFNIKSISKIPLFYNYLGEGIMTLYNSPTFLLDNVNKYEITQNFLSDQNNQNLMPRPLRQKHIWSRLIKSFIQTETFEVWFQTKMQVILKEILIETSKHAIGMTPDQLLLSYGLELKVESFNRLHYEHLIERIKLSIYLIGKIDNYGDESNIKKLTQFESSLLETSQLKSNDTINSENNNDDMTNQSDIRSILESMRIHLSALNDLIS